MSVGSLISTPPQATRTGIYVDGEWRDSARGQTFAVEDPATGGRVGMVADAEPQDALDALDAADRAQGGWAATAPRDRGDVLRRAYELLLDRTDAVARTISLEMGKALSESRAEVRYGAEFLRWFSEEAVRIGGRWGQLPEGTATMHVSRRPVGPCYLVTPWNFPLAMVTRKVGPALAAGCTAVVKPADLTPLTAILMIEILEDAGLPPGVVNLLTTSRPGPVSDALLTDSRLRKLSFTGSTQVGTVLLAQAAHRVLRCSMELGGNAPFVVLEGADVEAAADGAVAAKFRNVGQACTAANRFLVHESLGREFANALTDRACNLRLGPGLDEDTDLGPLISESAVRRALSIVDDAVARGATIQLGGRRLDRSGHFLEPTVLTGVAPDSRAMTDEIFAPVAPITTFSTAREALLLSNRTDYGLAAYVYAADEREGQRFASGLEAGMVGLNLGVISNAAAPFGGVKSSGLGREGGTEGIGEYLSLHYTATPADPMV